MIKIESLIYAKISSIIDQLNKANDNKTANHFFKLLCRLQKGQKLTKKMTENLNGLQKQLKQEQEKYNV